MKTTKLSKNGISVILMTAFCVILILLTLNPVTIYASNSISLSRKADAISGYRNGTYDYLYFGSYDNKPMKWKILDNHTSTNEDGLFLLADYGIENSRFGDTNGYEGSDGQAWCRNFYKDSEHFTDAERDFILATTKEEKSNYKLPLNRIGYYCASSLNKEHLFFLSVAEAMDTRYGFTDNIRTTESRTVELDGRKRWWWLRSTYSEDPKRQCIIYRDGNITNDLCTRSVILARPAMNLTSDTSAVYYTEKCEENTYRLLIEDSTLKAPQISDTLTEKQSLSFQYQNLSPDTDYIYIIFTEKKSDASDTPFIHGSYKFPTKLQSEKISCSIPASWNADTGSILVFTESERDSCSTGTISKAVSIN